MSERRPLPVVCAVLFDPDHRVLVAQRPSHKHLGGKWEFPGGKVEDRERPEAALVREIQEELGCVVRVGPSLSRFTHDYGSVVIEMIPFQCTLAPGSPAPHPHEHSALAWVPVPELKAYDLAPADGPIVDELLRLAAAHGVHPRHSA